MGNPFSTWGLYGIRIRRLFLLKRNKRRSWLDPELGRVISNPPDPHAESCRNFTVRKSTDRSIVRPER